MRKTVLVVDDEKLIRWSLGNKLTSWGYDVGTAENVKDACEALSEHAYDLILLDIKLPDGSGIDVLRRVNAITPDTAVIMITAEGTVETAVQAMKLGAYDYVSKPFNLDEMRLVIEKALEKADMKKNLDYFKAHKKADIIKNRIIGESRAFRRVLELVNKVATSPSATVLLSGESGTGKNIIAREIHNRSDRAERPFVTIECSTMPENLIESELFGHEKGAFTDARSIKKGLFELANTGTVLVDEIGDLPLVMQSKLLRAIDERRFKRVGGVIDYDIDVRIIAATNIDLEIAVEQKRFRRDLFFRLNVVPVQLPPLRERGNDVILLAEFFMQEFNRQFNKDFKAISDDAKTLMLDYHWPGNIRELRNAVERAVLLESENEIRPEHLILKPMTETQTAGYEKPDRTLDDNLSLDEVEAKMIKRALAMSGGNQSKAAQILGVSRDVLRYRMKKYGIGKDSVNNGT